MCAILGLFNTPDAAAKALKGLQTLQNRGLDSFGLTDNMKLAIAKASQELDINTVQGSNMLGHCLHSIVGFVPEPFLSKKGKQSSSFVANCEIYNWRELNEKHKLNARNDAEVLFQLLDSRGNRKIADVLDVLDGPYAFAYWRGNEVTIARDILGIKPIWYSQEQRFEFASERKALLKLGYQQPEELNPRKLLIYNIEKNTVSFEDREFFSSAPEHKDAYDILVKRLVGLLTSAVAKRVPDQKVGILYSGGIDSLVIAWICKQLGVEFTCYTAAADESSKDLVWAQKTSKRFGFPLKIVKVPLAEIPALLKNVVPLIEDSNVVKVGVGLTMYAACGQARKDGVRVIFSGLGSEELFAGYERHRKTLEALDASKVNEECLWGLIKLYERDTYRDDVITMNNNMELRLPFLDKALVDFSLKIPGKYKLDHTQSKIILRDAAQLFGVPSEYASRKKIAAQYGSGFDKALQILAKQQGQTRSAYLRTYYPYQIMKLGCLFSSGKDSNLALRTMQEQNYEIACLITLQSRNPDSYMFHTPTIEMTRLQAEALGIPLLMQETAGEKEEELKDLEKAIKKAKNEYRIQGIVTGALYSNYQRERIEKTCDKLGLKIFCPLWHISQEDEVRELIHKGFEFMMTSVAAEGLDESWLNKRIGLRELDKLIGLNKKIGLNVAGEGGEYESLVLYGPGYRKRIRISKHSIKKDSAHSARMLIMQAKLTDSL